MSLPEVSMANQSAVDINSKAAVERSWTRHFTKYI